MLRYCNNIHSQRLRNVWGVRRCFVWHEVQAHRCTLAYVCCCRRLHLHIRRLQALKMKLTTATALDYYVLVLFPFSFLSEAKALRILLQQEYDDT